MLNSPEDLILYLRDSRSQGAPKVFGVEALHEPVGWVGRDVPIAPLCFVEQTHAPGSTGRSYVFSRNSRPPVRAQNAILRHSRLQTCAAGLGARLQLGARSADLKSAVPQACSLPTRNRYGTSSPPPPMRVVKNSWGYFSFFMGRRDLFSEVGGSPKWFCGGPAGALRRRGRGYVHEGRRAQRDLLAGVGGLSGLGAPSQDAGAAGRRR